MLSYSKVTSRAVDGAENRVIMKGFSGGLGYSDVYLQYLQDGCIHLYGANTEDSNAWKLLSAFELEPGCYTLTGMKNAEENSIALQLYISDDTGFYQYYYQWHDDVDFVVERPAKATLHVRVYPYVESVDIIARPAVYRNE